MSDSHCELSPRHSCSPGTPVRLPGPALRFFLLLMLPVVLLGRPEPAAAQFSVSHEEGDFRFTLTVNQLVIGLPDSIHASYTIENLADSAQTLELCCCGVEFFAIRDSSCTYEDLATEPTCQIAGCDACSTCFAFEVCQGEPCELLPLARGGRRVFTWDWDRVVCDGDTGSDLLLGNVGTFRIVAGYDRCEPPGLGQILSIPVEVLKVIPVVPTSWSGLKARHGDLPGEDAASPGNDRGQEP